MVLYGTLIFLIALFIQNRYLKLGLQLILGSCILLIGISRVYLGVHFPSDIIGGFSLGLGWLLLSYPYYQKQRFIWRFKNKQL
jgi:undecaprenyl-diphosphatase